MHALDAYAIMMVVQWLDGEITHGVIIILNTAKSAINR